MITDPAFIYFLQSHSDRRLASDLVHIFPNGGLIHITHNPMKKPFQDLAKASEALGVWNITLEFHPDLKS